MKNAVFAPCQQDTFIIIPSSGPIKIIGYYITEHENGQIGSLPVCEHGLVDTTDMVLYRAFHELNEDSPLYNQAFDEWGGSNEYDGLPWNKEGFAVLCQRKGIKINPSEQSIRDSIEKLGSSCSEQDSPEYCQMVCDRIRELKKDLFYHYGKEY